MCAVAPFTSHRKFLLIATAVVSICAYAIWRITMSYSPPSSTHLVGEGDRAVSSILVQIFINSPEKGPIGCDVRVEDDQEIKELLRAFIGLESDERVTGYLPWIPTARLTVKYINGDARLIDTNFVYWKDEDGGSLADSKASRIVIGHIPDATPARDLIVQTIVGDVEYAQQFRSEN